MHKKLIGLGVCIALLVSPLLASAQATSDNTSIIAQLSALVATLTQELQQLLAARNSQQSPQSNAVPGSPDGFSVSNTDVNSSANTATPYCASYAYLQKGATDASTGGAVSKLQSILGMPNVTGYYGAQTGIAYQNMCGNLGNAQPTSVAGMSKYTDSDFGFSFWYPSGWDVQQTPVKYQGVYGGGTISNEYMVTGSGRQILISEFNSNAQSIVVPSGPCGYCAEVVFAFSSTQGIWTKTTPNGAGGDASGSVQPTLPNPADISKNTMGGLHIFQSQQKDSVVIIPLSASKFVIVDDLTADQDDFQPAWSFVDTIVATNPAVAIPVSTSQQIAAIQAEANAYGTQSAQPSATIDQSSLTVTDPYRPVLSGTASGIESVSVNVTEIMANPELSGPYWNELVGVQNGRWTFSFPSSSGIIGGALPLGLGSYSVRILPNNNATTPLVSGTMIVTQ